MGRYLDSTVQNNRRGFQVLVPVRTRLRVIPPCNASTYLLHTKQIGLAALGKRLAYSITSANQPGAEDGGETVGNASESRKPSGVAAVLTLVDVDIHETVLGSGWGIDDGRGWMDEGEEGLVLAWREIIMCQGSGGGNDAGGDGSAWRRAREQGAVVVVRRWRHLGLGSYSRALALKR